VKMLQYYDYTGGVLEGDGSPVARAIIAGLSQEPGSFQTPLRRSLQSRTNKRDGKQWKPFLSLTLVRDIYIIATYSLPLLICKHKMALARGKVSSTPQTTRSRLSPQTTVNKSKLTPSSCPVRITGPSHPGPAPPLPKEWR
jgi:hypothetical protein